MNHLLEAWSTRITAASPRVRAYHGTNQAALEAIRRAGEFRASEPALIASTIEDRYNLPRGSVLNHKYNEFTRFRVGDPHIFFSGEESTATHYAELGSEVVSDCLFAAWHILTPDAFDEEGMYRPGMADRRMQWVRDETIKHYQPVVITVDLPLDVVMEHMPSQNKRDMKATPEEWYGYWINQPFTNLMLEAPISASYISGSKLAKLASTSRLLADLSRSEFDSKRWLYHGSSNEGDIDRMMSRGVRMSGVPMNLNRRRYMEGDTEGIFYQPGSGVGWGLYVSGDYWTAAGFGRHVIAIEWTADLKVVLPPESDDPLYKMEWALRDANGVLLQSNVPSSQVYLIEKHRTHQQKGPYEASVAYRERS